MTNQQLSIFDSQNQEQEDIKQRINTLRRLISVHSCIYYRLSSSLISDKKFDKLCRELYQLQEENPQIANEGIYSKEFKDFGPATAFDLDTIRYSEIRNKAKQLIKWFEGGNNVRFK